MFDLVIGHFQKMKLSRVLSEKHFTWLFKAKSHVLSLRHIIYLVKDVTTQTYSWSQYYNPSLKPIAAYLHGHDITRFLTHKNQLTRYSYYFLNYVYSVGFTIKDVRSYFNGFWRISNREPDTKLLAERGVRRPYKRSAISQQAVTSAQAADVTGIPMDTSSPGFKIYQNLVDTPRSTTVKAKVDDRFDDARLFTTALRLASLHIKPFKYNETKLECYARLKAAGFGTDVLKKFRAYLTDRFGVLDPVRLLNELARTFGYNKNIQYGGPDTLIYTFGQHNLAEMRLSEQQLVTKLFPDEVVLFS